MNSYKFKVPVVLTMGKVKKKNYWLNLNNYHTWHHPTGRKYRVDHALLPIFWQRRPQRTGIPEDIDISLHHIDYRPLLASIDLDHPVLPKRPRKTYFNQLLIQDDEVAANIRKEIHQVPIVPWELDTTSHAKIFDERLLDIVRRHTHTRRRPSALWMSCLSWRE